MGLIVLDANVLIAVTQHSHQFHSQALSIVSSIDNDFVAHPITLAEFLIYPAQLGKFEEAERDLADLGISSVPDSVAVAAIQPHRLTNLRVKYGLKIPDALVVAAADIMGAKLASFDKQIQTAAQSLQIDLVTNQ